MPFAFTGGRIDPQITLWSHRHRAGFQGQFHFIAAATITRQEPSEAAKALTMSTHQAGDLLVVPCFTGLNFAAPAGWTNRTFNTSAGRMGFYTRIAATGSDTFLIAANADTERGRFLQCATFRSDGGAPTFVRTDDLSGGTTPDAGTYARSGLVVDADTDTLALVVSSKIGENYSGVPDPPLQSGLGGGFLLVGETVETFWNGPANRFSSMMWGYKLEQVSSAIADGAATASPAIWTLGGSASGSVAMRWTD